MLGFFLANMSFQAKATRRCCSSGYLLASHCFVNITCASEEGIGMLGFSWQICLSKQKLQ